MSAALYASTKRSTRDGDGTGRREALHGERRRFGPAVADGVDPQVGGGPQQVRAGVPDLVVDAPEDAECPQQGVLDQVFGVPQVPGQTAAVAVQGGPQRRQQVDVAVPRASQLVPERVRHLEIRLGAPFRRHPVSWRRIVAESK